MVAATHPGGSQDTNAQALSVVVPIYNVEAYLEECLESIAGQSVQDFEVLMVDDGSTDASSEIANRWANQDDRFRLIRQSNHGLGHARNTGAAHASGRYLTFLDSDDRADTDAYRRMIDALEQTRSDFATGNVHRFDSSGRTWQAPLYKGFARTEQLATHVSTAPELLRDHLAPNKVWRTSFWREGKIEFPVGVLYEDVPTIIPAHVIARSVDVVPVVAALWRVRDQGDSSITQNRGKDVRHLHDRVDAVTHVSEFIAKHVGQHLKDEYDALVLRRDLRWYVDLYPEVDENYQRELFTCIGRFLAHVSPEALRKTPAAMRVAYELLNGSDWQDFAEYVALRRADKVKDLPVTVVGDRAVLEIPLTSGHEIDVVARDVTTELVVASRTARIAVKGDHIVIDGWAHVSRLAPDADQRITVTLMGNAASIPADVTYRRDDAAAADVGAVAESTGRIAFTARVPLRSLRRTRLQRLLRREGTSWTVQLTVRCAGLTCSAPLARPLPGPAERPLLVELGDGTWLRICWTKLGLNCRVRAEGAVLDAIRGEDDVIEIAVRTGARIGAGAQLRIRGPAGGRNVRVQRDPHDRRSVRGQVRVTKLPGWDEDHKTWSVFFRRSPRSSWQRVVDAATFRSDVLRVGGHELTLRRTKAAAAELIRGAAGPVVCGAEWGPGATLRLRLRDETAGGIDALQLSAVRQDEHVTFDVKREGAVLGAKLPLGALDRFGDRVALRAGTWNLTARTSAGVEVPARIDEGLALPIETSNGGRKYALTDRQISTLSVIVETDLGPAERGTVNQNWLRTEFYPSAGTSIRNVVLYEAYFGKQFSDSPREVFAELDQRGMELEHVVVVRDQQVAVPPGATAVAYRSREYYTLLAQAKYIVANTHLPSCFRRSSGQTVLQTWHGVGTKKIGLDIVAAQFANRTYHENIRNGESDNWDYLVSPNPFTSPILRRAFAFNGTLLETGVPRNDIFHRPDKSEHAARIRNRLGIDGSRKIVLYAPTWRDNLHDGPGRYRLDLRLDLYKAARKIGDDYVLMFRKHSNVIDRLPAGTGSVIDVSDYPEVQELLLVTDILVSDYSTLMCDFANTGRPMLFYTYDLANYRDVLRGFYFDFENEVPGPLITEEADIVPAILDAQNIREGYGEKYQGFVQRFCPWDDGHASARVVDVVFGMEH